MNRRMPMKAIVCITVANATSPKKSQNTSLMCVPNDIFANTSVPFRKHRSSNPVEHSIGNEYVQNLEIV